jgi:hypothetical protein
MTWATQKQRQLFRPWPSERVERFRSLPLPERDEYLDGLPRDELARWMGSLSRDEVVELVGASSQRLKERAKSRKPPTARECFDQLVSEIVERVEVLNEHVTDEIGDHILKDESRACIRVFKECVQQLRTIADDNESVLKALTGALNTAHTLGMVRQDLPALYRGMTRTRAAAKARAKKSEEGYGPLDGLVLSLTRKHPDFTDSGIAHLLRKEIAKHNEQSKQKITFPKDRALRGRIKKLRQRQ